MKKETFATSVKLDPVLREIARDLGLNLREVLEQAIREKIQHKTCPLCGQQIKHKN